MIEIRNVEKSYSGETKVLDGITLNIQEGCIYGLVGRSGAGKSTLLRCINGLESYNKGSFIVDGQEVKSLDKKNLRDFRKNIGMIFQNFSLAERMNVYQNVALPLKWWKYEKSAIDKKVNELLKLVGLEDKKFSKPRELSGGQKQRVAIARALAMDPKILLCDEATSALDPNTTTSILELLKDINKKMNITIIVVAHEMAVVQKICDYIALLDHGKIVIEGQVKDIFLNHPEALERLTGETAGICPDKGVNIRALLNEEQMEQTTISDMALETKAAFSIVHSETYTYKNSRIQVMVFNIDQADKEIFESYLTSHKIEWQEVV